MKFARIKKRLQSQPGNDERPTLEIHHPGRTRAENLLFQGFLAEPQPKDPANLPEYVRNRFELLHESPLTRAFRGEVPFQRVKPLWSATQVLRLRLGGTVAGKVSVFLAFAQDDGF